MRLVGRQLALDHHQYAKKCLSEAYKTLQMLQSMDDNESLGPRLQISLAALGEYFTEVMSVANARFKFIEERGNILVPGEWPAGRSSNAHLPVRQLMNDGWCLKQINKMRSMTTSALYFVSRMERPGRGVRGHHSCDADRCLALQINEKEYKTK